MRSSSMWQAARERMGYRPNIRTFGQQAHFGDTSTDWIDRLPKALALRPACLILGEEVNSVNKGGASGQVATINGLLDQVIAQAASAGVRLLILTDTRLTASYSQGTSPDKYAIWQGVNAYRAGKHQTWVGGMYIVYSATNTSVPDTPWVSKDGVHDSNNGALFNTGKKHAANLAPYWDAARALPVRGAAMAGELNSNPFFTGTSGAKATTSGVAPTGTVATGYTVRNFNAPGVNCVCSVEDNSDGTFNQVLAITGAAPGTGTGRIRLQAPNFNVSRGQRYRTLIEYDVTNGAGTGRPSNIDAIGLTGAAFGFGDVSINGPSSWGSGSILAGATEGHVPMPRKAGLTIYNYGTASDSGETIEAWMEGYPSTMPVDASAGQYVDIYPEAGSTVDILVRFRCWHNVQESDAAYALPYYQGTQFTRPQDGQLYHVNDYMRVYSGDGNIQAAGVVPAAGKILVFTAGEWSGGGLSYAIALEKSSDSGATWTTAVADLAAVNWTWTATAETSGTRLRMKGTATNSYGTSVVSTSDVVGIYA